MLFKYREYVYSRHLPSKLIPELFCDAGQNAGAGITNCGMFMKQLFFDEEEKRFHINTLEFLSVTSVLESGNLQALYPYMKVKLDSKVVLSWIEHDHIPDTVSIVI